jgi:DNA modification methylase
VKSFICDDITIYNADCLTLLHTLPSRYTIITDTPYTMMTASHCADMMTMLHYDASDVLVLTNPLAGYIYRGDFHIVPELSTAPTEYHRHQRPLEELTKLVAMTQGIVVDPYCGSGTTLLAAQSLGRASIGIEVDKSSFERCCYRVENVLQSLANMHSKERLEQIQTYTLVWGVKTYLVDNARSDRKVFFHIRR